MTDIKTFEQFNNAEITVSGLKCDNPKCDYEDMSVPFSDYKNSIGKPCPKCGQSLLTQKDYDEVVNMMDAMEMINMYSPDDVSKLVANLSMDEIDGALDVINTLKLKKEGEDDQGREIWKAKY